MREHLHHTESEIEVPNRRTKGNQVSTPVVHCLWPDTAGPVAHTATGLAPVTGMGECLSLTLCPTPTGTTDLHGGPGHGLRGHWRHEGGPDERHGRQAWQHVGHLLHGIP